MKSIAFTFVQLFCSILIGLISNLNYELDLMFWLIEILSLTSGITLLFLFFKDPKFRFSLFFSAAMFILLLYPLGIINTYINVKLISVNWLNFLSSQNINFNDLIQAELITNLFCISLILLGVFFQKGKFSTESLYYQAKYLLQRRKKYLWNAIMIVVCFQLFLIFTGEVSLQGVNVESNKFGSHPFYSFVKTFSAFVPFVLFYFLKDQKKKRILIFILIEFFWFFLFGRRSIGFFFLFSFLGYYFTQPIKIPIKKFYYLAFLSLLFFQSTSLFQSLRLTGAVNILQKELSINTIKVVIKNYKKFDLTTIEKIAKESFVSRSSTPMIALAKFHHIFTQTSLPHLNGLDLKNNLLMVLPSDFFVKKTGILVQEELYNEKYSSMFNEKDIGESIWLQAYIDFGYIGVILSHPLIYFIVAWLSLLFFRLVKFFDFQLLVYLLFYAYGILLMEGTLKSYFVDWRNIFTIALLVLPIQIFTKKLFFKKETRILIEEKIQI